MQSSLKPPAASSAEAGKKPIRVFLVDDSPLALVMLKRMLATSPEIEIVGTARNGREALACFERTRPEVICTDYHMPDMDGLELIEQTMAEFPRPILVISSIIHPDEREKAFPLLAAGAVDVFPKPTADTPFELAARSLVHKIKILSGVMVISRRHAKHEKAASTATPVARPKSSRSPSIVAIGASTGGPQVLQAILSKLPSDFPCPILCVQHISAGFLQGLVTWLDGQCPLRVKIAEADELAAAGTIYFAPGQYHLEINRHGRLLLSNAPAVDGHRPSVTMTFQSVARTYGSQALSVLLTGMGSDGATGLLDVSKAGGLTIAQNEESCIVFGMPNRAIELGAAQHVLPADEIAQSLIRLTARTAT